MALIKSPHDPFRREGPFDCARATLNPAGPTMGTNGEIALIEAEGLWANADLWIAAPDDWWEQPSVMARIYAITGAGQMLAAEACLHEMNPTPPAGGMRSARVCYARGWPCYAFRATIDSTGSSVTARETGLAVQAELITWGTETDNDIASVFAASFGVGTASLDPAAAAQLSADPSPRKKGLLLQAPIANTDSVFYGFSSLVTIATGLELEPGKAHFLPINDPSNVWITSPAAAQEVRWGSF